MQTTRSNLKGGDELVQQVQPIISKLPDAVWCPYGHGSVLVKPRTKPAEAWIVSNTEGPAEQSKLYRIEQSTFDNMTGDGFRLRRMPTGSTFFKSQD